MPEQFAAGFIINSNDVVLHGFGSVRRTDVPGLQQRRIPSLRRQHLSAMDYASTIKFTGTQPVRRGRRGAFGGLLVAGLLSSVAIAQAQSRPDTSFDARFFFKLNSRPADTESARTARPHVKSRVQESQRARNAAKKLTNSPAEAVAGASPGASPMKQSQGRETAHTPSLVEKPAAGGDIGLYSLLQRIAAKPLAIGRAGYYELSGRRTANGENYDPDGLTASHKSLAFGTRLRVVNLRNNKSVVVRVNDRSPARVKFAIDLSRGSANAIGITKRQGTGTVALYKLD